MSKTILGSLYRLSIYLSIFMASDSFILSPLQLLKSASDFLYFWYIKNAKDSLKKKMNFVKGVERDLGIIINLKMITQPIYGDYTLAGKLIGPILRLGRVLFGCLLVFVAFVFTMIIYTVYLLLPIVVSFMILKNVLYILAG